MYLIIGKGYSALLGWLYNQEKTFERIGLKWFWYEYTNEVYNLANMFMALAHR